MRSALAAMSRRAHGDVAAGRGQGEGFDVEVVVDGVPRGVVGGVGDRVAAEGDVADCGGEAVFGDAGGFEAFVTDLSRGVKQGGDRGGGGISFDADHHSLGGGVGDECSGPATGFEHPAAGKPGPA
jgi:hypothetical protein